MELLGATKGIIGIKAEYGEAIAALAPHLSPQLHLHLLGSHYPAGDEFILVYEATGRSIPPGGLPKDVGCVVNNVETLINIAMQRPVTHKYLTVGGAVVRPQTICAPLGASLTDCVAACGGASAPRWLALEGGVMMGRLCDDQYSPVSKTTGGFILLPQDHPLLGRYLSKWSAISRRARAACDQCNFCTELCPRRLLGHPIQPHLAMRALGFNPTPNGAAAPDTAGAAYCCECNLCSLVVCPEDLDPKSVMVQAKQQTTSAQSTGSRVFEPHPLYAARRQPLSRIKARLGLTEFSDFGPLVPRPLEVERVCISLHQGLCAPGEPVVSVGENVAEGQLIAHPPTDQLGSPLHASLSGVIRQVNESVVIER